MLQTDYLKRVRVLIEDLETGVAAQADAAAETIVEALVAGNQLFISSLGHGNDGDLLHRALRLRRVVDRNEHDDREQDDRPHGEAFAPGSGRSLLVLVHRVRIPEKGSVLR